jgi:hypothetical protein
VTDCTWGIYINSGTASDNVVNNCYCGIEGYTNGVLIKGNTIIKCAYGLWAAGGSIIGNTVVTNSGQTGINIATFDYVLLVQNTVSGVGTPVANATAACVKVPNTNAGL